MFLEDGKEGNIWQDPWIPAISSRRPESDNLHQSQVSSVNELMVCSGSGALSWNLALKTLFWVGSNTAVDAIQAGGEGQTSMEVHAHLLEKSARNPFRNNWRMIVVSLLLAPVILSCGKSFGRLKASWVWRTSTGPFAMVQTLYGESGKVETWIFRG